LRVLVVDDEPAIRALARMMLERSDYSVEDAGTASAAVACVQSAGRPFDVIVLDYTLPDRLGTAVLPELRRLAPQARLILTSGRLEQELPNHGADAYLPKPFARPQLLAAVQAVALVTA
jgi:DNA-binding response OmpR family regulator